MIGTSARDYIFIQTCIFLLQLLARLGIAYSLVSSLVHLPFQSPRVLDSLLTFETIFYLSIYLPLKAYLQRAARHPLLSLRNVR